MQADKPKFDPVALLNTVAEEPPIDGDEPDFSEWEEMRPLTRLIEPAAPYPMDALLGLAEPARRANQLIQSADAICANSFLSAAALSVQSRADLQIDNRDPQPISLFTASLAESGDRKSAVEKVALRYPRQWQKQQMEVYDVEKQRYDDAMAVYEKERGKILKGGSDRKSTLAELESLEKPVEPAKPIILLSEPTYEGLIRLLVTGHPSVGLFTDEGARFLGGHAMNKENLLKTASGLTGLWDSGEADRVRSGDGSQILYGKRFSAHLMIQPELAGLLVDNTMLRAQGFLARFLIARPERVSKVDLQSDLNTDPIFQRYHDRIRDIFSAPLSLKDGTVNVLKPNVIRLDTSARRLYGKFLTDLEAERSSRWAAITAWAGRAHDLAGRVAAVLQLFDNECSAYIDAEHYEAARDIVLHSMGEWVRITESSHKDPFLEQAQSLLNWLVEKKKTEISLAEVCHRGPNSIRSVATARNLMAALVQHGFARRIDKRLKYDGVVRRECFEIRTTVA